MVTFTAQATGPIFENKQLATNLDPQIVAMLADVGAYAQRLAVDKAPSGVTYALRGSILSELRGTPASRSQEVFSNLFYAPIVETGRRPGRPPPVDALLTWVGRKLGGGQDARSVAFLVARQIGRRGTKGAHMFEQAFTQAVPYFEQQAEALGDRIAGQANG